MLSLFPELERLHQQASVKCILDHEVIVMKNGLPDFYEVQKRTIMGNTFKIKLAAEKYPASIVAYDILYYKNKDITMLPLIERKKYLQEVIAENNIISVSRYIEDNGIKLFELVKEKGLEGIVAKKKNSLYWQGKKSKDWVKCKVMAAGDYIVCGYISKANSMSSIIIGQYNKNELIYKGHVSLGVSMRVLNQHQYKIISYSPFRYVPPGNEEAVWIEPELVCIIEYMPSNKEGIRQATFKGIRCDKSPCECQE